MDSAALHQGPHRGCSGGDDGNVWETWSVRSLNSTSLVPEAGVLLLEQSV